MSKQKGRRGNNEGSIYKRNDGRWCAETTIGYGDDGRPIRKYLYGKERKEVAKKLMPYIKNYFDLGSLTERVQKTNFMSALNDWFLLYKVPVIKSRTQEKLWNFIKNHIDPAFANFEMSEIDATKCQCFFNSLIQKELCQESIKQIKQLLNQFFTFAVKNHLATSNPINEVKVSCNIRRDDKNEKMALSQIQRRQVICAALNDSILKPIIIVLMFTGIRPGELLALKWENIDFSTSLMNIRGALSQKIEFDDNGKVLSRESIISNTKTVLSNRTFIMPSCVRDALKEWYDFQKSQENERRVLVSENSLVFCTNDGRPRTYSGLRSLLNRFLRKNMLHNQGISLYTFRHTFATILLEEHENPKIVADLMGHADVRTTLSVYSHIISRSVYEDTAKTLNDIYDDKTIKPSDKSLAALGGIM